MDDAALVAVRLAREGYGGGDPERILATPVDLVVLMMHQERFRSDYERAFLALNSEARK